MVQERSIAELGEGLRCGAFTAADLAFETLDLIRASNPKVHAFVAITQERALAEAGRADRELRAGTDRGPLHGIPYAAKDLFDVAGVSTTAHSRLLLCNIAARDAVAVDLLTRAGAVLVGKTATYEHAIEPWPVDDGPFPPARNPRNVAHITGGSSSGSAAAVAAGLVRFALGTDTGGSVRSPAGYCGVVGLKPSYGAISSDGVVALSPSLDHVGVLAASVEEAALAFDALAKEKDRVQATKGLDGHVAGALIGYARRFFADAAPAEFIAALDSAAQQLASLGAEVIEVDLPAYDLFEACGRIILQAEAYGLHTRTLRSDPGAYGRLAFQSLVSGAVLSTDDLRVARQAQQLLTEALNQIFRGCNALLTANVLATAPRFDALATPGRRWTPMRTFPFNVTGHPALALPLHEASNGLPMGLQLVAPAGDEAMLCRVGAALEREFSKAPGKVRPAPVQHAEFAN
jgi:aspartyl-tRNA(Asn)/glutamyl-tRNA(Gln) amidotransferase subunit A